MARIKKAKISEKKLFIKVLSALDVKITFPIHGTAIGSLTALFSAGCPACKETIEMVNRMACASCEITVLDMQDTRIAAKELGISTVPAVVIGGKLAS